ncbi:hypothetical protein Tco_0759388 [Tanacetum coccineum]
MNKGITWDKLENPNPQSTPQVLPSFEEYTPPMTHPEEVEETIGIPMEVKPFDQTQLEDVGFNTCSHDLILSSREIPSVDEPEPQLLPSFSLLDVNLGDKKEPTHPSTHIVQVIFVEKKLETLGWLLEEIHVNWAHLDKKQTRLRLYTKSFEEIMHTERGDGVANPKRRRQDFQDDGVRYLATASERSRLKKALKESTW